MENPIKVPKGRRKENIPPRLSRDATPEHRHIQKNVDINLFVEPFTDVAVSRQSSRTAVPSSNCKRAAAQGKSEVAAVGGAKPHRRVLVQTNLSCPYPPSWDTPCGVSGGSFRQQSNLETKLRCRRAENVACVGDASCLRTGDLGSGCSCLDGASLKSGPQSGSSGRRKCWSPTPGEGRDLCGLPHSCSEISQSRTGSKEPHVLSHPRGCCCMSEESDRTAGDSFCPAQSCERPFPHDRCWHPESSSRNFSSSPSGPALTLDHLRSSASVESHVTSATLHILLRSSQVSADLHSSIQHLKRGAASMGALGSFPGEPKSLLLPHPSRFDPPVPSAGRLGAAEQFGAEESCAKQASAKWRDSFTRGWGMGSTTGTWEVPRPSGCGCRNAGLETLSMEASGHFCPSAFCGGAASPSWVCQGEEGCSNPSFSHLGSCSRIPQVPERKSPTSRLKTHYQQTVLDPEKLSSRFFHCHEPCHPSFDGLEVSLETLCARPPLDVGVTVDSTHGEVHMTLRSPGVDLLGTGSSDMDLRDLQDEAEGTGGVLPAPQVMGESVLFLPAHNSLEEMAGKRLGGPLSAAGGSLGPTGFGGTAPVARNSSKGECWPEAGKDRGDKSLAGKKLPSSEFPWCEKSRGGMDAVPKVHYQSALLGLPIFRVPPQSALLLAKYFAAWRNRVFGKKAAAQALYGRQLLRKGLGALKWAVTLQHVQDGIAQWRHSRTVLAACFRRWQRATVKRQEERASQLETETPHKVSPAVLGGEKPVKGPVSRQLSAECVEAATQYGRAEGNLWLQICRYQGVDEPDRKAQTFRDMRRLAAAFRLWRLEKERLDAEASRTQVACALLEKKRLRNAFEMWRSRYRVAERIWPLMARIQRRMVSRCFSIWKGCAERKSRARCSLDRRRVGALRLCFRQWAQMVQVRERARETLLELLALRRRAAYARFGFALDALKMQPHLTAVRHFQRNGCDTLNSLCAALMLQETFYTWKARWRQQQQLDAFRQSAEQKLLREALGRWCWRALRPPPFKRRAEDLAEDLLLTSLDSDEHSVSSGFHSNAPAPPAFPDSSEREGSLRASSPGSVSSLATIPDTSPLLQHLSPPPTPFPGREDPGDEAAAFRAPASSPLGDQHGSGTDGFVRDPFQSSGLLHPECGIRSIAASSSGGVASPGGEEKETFENQRQLLARCFALWSSWTLQNLKGKQLRRHRLLSRAFISWSVAAACAWEQRKAQVWLESIRQPRLLASCFARWKAELSRAQQRREEERRLRRRPPGSKAVWRWRKAVRGYQALQRSTGTIVQQSCNYWTKASAFHLCRREQSSLVRAPKFMKMPLCWPNKQRRNREEGLPPSVAVRARLKGSAFYVWLVVYRSQSSTAWSSPRGPPDRAEWRVTHAKIQSSGAELDSTRWLWRKYLRLWRCNVLLRRFQEAWRMRHLARAWLLWKDTCQAEWLVQALARQRLAVWGWKVWRRRYLQAWVAERFLEAQDRSLLKRAFGRWRDLAANVNSQPQGSF